MDEPTNHLDIGSADALENALLAFDGTIIAVSHDRYFINKIATRIIDIDQKDRLFDCVLEDYDDAYGEYMRQRELIRAETVSQKQTQATSDSKQDYEKKKRENAERRSLERKIEKAKEKAASLEEELSKLDEELFTSAASDYVRAAEIDKRKSEIEEELLSLYELIM
jgi:ATP-binding cassette subfamily F protein 3